jgi:hypothetical protein
MQQQLIQPLTFITGFPDSLIYRDKTTRWNHSQREKYDRGCYNDEMGVDCVSYGCYQEYYESSETIVTNLNLFEQKKKCKLVSIWFVPPILDTDVEKSFSLSSKRPRHVFFFQLESTGIIFAALRLLEAIKDDDCSRDKNNGRYFLKHQSPVHKIVGCFIHCVDKKIFKFEWAFKSYKDVTSEERIPHEFTFNDAADKNKIAEPLHGSYLRIKTHMDLYRGDKKDDHLSLEGILLREKFEFKIEANKRTLWGILNMRNGFVKEMNSIKLTPHGLKSNGEDDDGYLPAPIKRIYSNHDHYSYLKMCFPIVAFVELYDGSVFMVIFNSKENEFRAFCILEKGLVGVIPILSQLGKRKRDSDVDVDQKPQPQPSLININQLKKIDPMDIFGNSSNGYTHSLHGEPPTILYRRDQTTGQWIIPQELCREDSENNKKPGSESKMIRNIARWEKDYSCRLVGSYKNQLFFSGLDSSCFAVIVSGKRCVLSKKFDLPSPHRIHSIADSFVLTTCGDLFMFDGKSWKSLSEVITTTNEETPSVEIKGDFITHLCSTGNDRCKFSIRTNIDRYYGICFYDSKVYILDRTTDCRSSTEEINPSRGITNTINPSRGRGELFYLDPWIAPNSVFIGGNAKDNAINLPGKIKRIYLPRSKFPMFVHMDDDSVYLLTRKDFDPDPYSIPNPILIAKDDYLM